MECARVYIDKHKWKDLTIKCILCCREFEFWTKFVQHVRSVHKYPDMEVLIEKDFEYEANDRPKVEASDFEEDLIILKEKSESEFIDSILVTQEESKGEDAFPVIKEKDDFIDIILETRGESKPEGAFPVLKAKSPEPQHESAVNVEFEVLTVDMVDTNIGAISDNEENMLSEVCDADDNDNEINKACDLIGSESDNEIVNQKNTKGVRPFFLLGKTNPKIMLDFIEIMRRHPCQWDPDNPLNIKETRDASSEEIAREMLNRWGIRMSAQVARTSVLQLCRWFEREFISLKYGSSVVKKESKRQKRGDHVCAHPEYFEKLYEFIPRQNIQLHDCDECDRRFRNERTLLAHKYKVHKGAIPFHCTFCNRGFVHLSSLRHHENRHTMERVWACDICDYQGVTKTDFQLHLVTHTDVRSYVCELCGAAYKSSTSLSVHKRSHGQPGLECHMCGKQFYENYRLKRHIKKHSEKRRYGARRNTKEADADRRKNESEMTELLEEAEHSQDDNQMEEKCGDTEANGEDIENRNIDEEEEEECEEVDIFSCIICELDFLSLKALHDHSNKMHS